MIVVDTNIIAYLIVRGEQTENATKAMMRDSEWHAPLLWRSEFTNVLAQHVRLRELPLASAKEHFHFAESLMKGREHAVDAREVLDVSISSGASAYDCEFIVLARDLRVDFVTTDRKLAVRFPEQARLLADFVR